jgi:hypothetical protein
MRIVVLLGLRTDDATPSWIANELGAFVPTIGTHTLNVKAYRRDQARGRVVLKQTIRVTVIDSNMAPSPMNEPVAAPIKPTIKQPTPAPTQCVDDIVAFINRNTLVQANIVAHWHHFIGPGTHSAGTVQFQVGSATVHM